MLTAFCSWVAAFGSWVAPTALVLLAGGCADPGGFMDTCSTDEDCRAGYVCPDGNAMGMSNVGFICTPTCSTDEDCRTELEQPDVECRHDLCVQQCFDDSQCPGTQPECRGSHPSCAGLLPAPHFCAQADGFTCE